MIYAQDGSKPRTVKVAASMVMGRAPECELLLDDTYVSQQHARLFGKNGSWYVEDLGSTNGTFVNEQRLAAPAMVQPGDRIRVGTDRAGAAAMKIEVGVATDIGRVREGNEDSYLVEPPLYAVADGMGGHRGRRGRVAARPRDDRGALPRGRQARSPSRCARRTARSSRDRRRTGTSAGMGTTLTAAQIEEGAAPARARRATAAPTCCARGALRQLTDDHTLVNRMVKAGEITEAEAEVHPHRNVLTRALGTEAEVHVDEDEVPLMDGDRLLLCSDGLFGMVAEDQMQAILEAEPDPQRAADRLIKAANRAGGVDNITVVVLDAHDDGSDDAAAVEEATDLTPGERVLRENAPTIRRWIAGAVIAVVLLAGALVALRVYVDRQWYVGVAEREGRDLPGHPATPLGYELHSVAEVTEIAAADAEALELYATLPEGISANSREEADAIVEQIRTDIAAAEPPKKGAERVSERDRGAAAARAPRPGSAC